jgi:hypothetical protein
VPSILISGLAPSILLLFDFVGQGGVPSILLIVDYGGLVPSILLLSPCYYYHLAVAIIYITNYENYENLLTVKRGEDNAGSVR